MSSYFFAVVFKQYTVALGDLDPHQANLNIERDQRKNESPIVIECTDLNLAYTASVYTQKRVRMPIVDPSLSNNVQCYYAEQRWLQVSVHHAMNCTSCWPTYYTAWQR